jgi:hypothetical protein
MTKANKNSNNFENSNWWQPNKVEKIMLWLTVATVLVSVVAQASSIVNNLLQFDNIYRQLYPLLNIFHIYVLFYIIFNLQNIKQLIPEPLLSPKDDDKNNYFGFRKKLKQWIINHFGKIYWEDKDKVKDRKDDEDDKLDKYIGKLAINTNKNIEQTYTYFMGVFGCFVLLYVFELINSFTYSVNEPILLILTMIFNNIATLFWFYIYLTFNATKTTIEINQDNIIKHKNGKIEIKWEDKTKKKKENYTCVYKRNKRRYRSWRALALSGIFHRPDKFDLYEKGDKRYKSIEIPKKWNWKFIALLLLIVSVIAFIYFGLYFRHEKILEIEKIIALEKSSSQERYLLLHYYLFRGVSTISILLGGCAMLATFSRLSSGFKKVPLAAFLIMIFYAALQPLFFAGSEFSSSNMKIGQLLFIANALCLLGKFGLLHLIKWFFGNYHIAYYFIAGKIVKDKKNDLKLNELFLEKTDKVVSL